MNLILIQPEEVQAGQVRLTDRRADHLRKILKVREDDTVRVGVVGGLMGSGTICGIAQNEVVLQVKLDTPPPAKLDVDLILALPRPIMLKRVLAQVAAMGVRHLFLVNANRVEKSFFDASPVKDGGFLTFLENGLEQAVDTILPTISVHPRFKPFIEDVIPARVAACKLIAHPDGGVNLAERIDAATESGTTLLAIGPEGGWIDYEVVKFQDAGFQPFSLGPRILRVDTAVPAIIAQIDFALQRKASRLR
ncbi:MAG: 16S rRNA (uracil(1498)-N(3))-methyltransferase [Desulfobulbaceae bacterium]|nr:16S rRNA (uracil(1498)-N(3))-methyltransferase [Desulfobulbaceae bacterium]